MTNEAYVTHLTQYVVPASIQSRHTDNIRDIEDLNQQETLILFATEKGLVDLKIVNPGPLPQIVTRTLAFHLPPFLTPKFWEDYRLSYDTILTYFNSFHPLHLWSLCLLFNINISSPAIRPNYSNSVGIIVQAKACAKQRLREMLQRKYKAVTQFFATSYCSEDSHNPELPVFVVPSSIIEHILPSVPTLQQMKSPNLRQPIPFPRSFVIRNKKYVPLEVLVSKSRRQPERKYILMIRVISGFSYFYTYGIPSSLSMDPLYLTLKDERGEDQLFCGIDECIYLCENEENPNIKKTGKKGPKKRQRDGASTKNSTNKKKKGPKKKQKTDS